MKYSIITKRELDALEVGDRVTRILGGMIAMAGIITHKGLKFLKFSLLESQEEIDRRARNAAKFVWNDETKAPQGVMPFWIFNSSTGLEVDEDLGADGTVKTLIISYLSVSK